MATYDVYTTGKVDAKISECAKKTTMPAGKTVTDTVTFQDLIDMGFVNPPS